LAATVSDGNNVFFQSLSIVAPGDLHTDKNTGEEPIEMMVIELK
jgi:hypothetical protein